MSVPSLASGGWQELEVQGKTFVFASEQTSKLLGMVDRVAQSPAIVLITGETGSGKELFSRLLHERSRRRGRPWVDINCAALPENLVESELFGSRRERSAEPTLPSRASSRWPIPARCFSTKSANSIPKSR